MVCDVPARGTQVFISSWDKFVGALKLAKCLPADKASSYPFWRPALEFPGNDPMALISLKGVLLPVFSCKTLIIVRQGKKHDCWFFPCMLLFSAFESPLQCASFNSAIVASLQFLLFFLQGFLISVCGKLTFGTKEAFCSSSTFNTPDWLGYRLERAFTASDTGHWNMMRTRCQMEIALGVGFNTPLWS